ncbi:MAG: FTR1 family protein [Microcystaceae cyanobacterium]
MDISAALPTFVVTLREGFEAALVVGIVLACLQKAQQSSLNRWVYRGIGAGLVASIMLGIALGTLLQGINTSETIYQPVIKEILVTVFGAIAVGLLSWMLVWMTQQAKQVKFDVENQINEALTDEKAAGRGIFLLVFIAVVREGFETVLFILAKFQETWLSPTFGAIAGLLAATILGVLLFKVGVRINIRLFFKIMGIFLLLIVGGLVISVLKHADASLLQLSYLNDRFSSVCVRGAENCILGGKFWDFSQSLPDKQFPGILLKALLGYRSVIYWGQAIAYTLFMMTVGGIYWQSLSESSSGNKSQKLKTET